MCFTEECPPPPPPPLPGTSPSVILSVGLSGEQTDRTHMSGNLGEVWGAPINFFGHFASFIMLLGQPPCPHMAIYTKTKTDTLSFSVLCLVPLLLSGSTENVTDGQFKSLLMDSPELRLSYKYATFSSQTCHRM